MGHPDEFLQKPIRDIAMKHKSEAHFESAPA